MDRGHLACERTNPSRRQKIPNSEQHPALHLFSTRKYQHMEHQEPRLITDCCCDCSSCQKRTTDAGKTLHERGGNPLRSAALFSNHPMNDSIRFIHLVLRSLQRVPTSALDHLHSFGPSVKMKDIRIRSRVYKSKPKQHWAKNNQCFQSKSLDKNENT
jgi:hypothetical protein